MESNCAICLKYRTNLKKITVKQPPDDESWLEKLRKIVSDVDWQDIYYICKFCSFKLEECWKFQKLCIELNTERQKLLEDYLNEINNKVEEILIEVIEDEENTVQHDILIDNSVIDAANSLNQFEYDQISNIIRPIIDDKIKVKMYYCSICNQQFKDIYELLTHNKSSHIKRKPYKPRIIQNRLLPMIKHKRYNCDICNKKGFIAKSLINHYVDVHKADPKLVKKYKCELCTKRFTWPDAFYKHLQTPHRSTLEFKCSECEDSFPDKISLLRHIRMHKFQCDYCGRIYHMMDELKQHQSCGECQKKSESVIELMENSKESLQNLSSNMDVDDESVIKEEVNTLVKVELQCEFCGKSYKTKRCFNYHMAHSHGDKLSNIAITSTNYGKKYICQFCPKMYFDRTKLERHVHIHTGLKRYECELCDIKFTDRYNVRVHFKNVHNTEIELGNIFPSDPKDDSTNTNYNCEICTTPFPKPKLLIDHTVEMHRIERASVKPFQCDQCLCRFVFKHHLLDHRKYHQVASGLYICSFCGNFFENANNLKLHEKKHLNVKTFKCDLCKKSFIKKQYLIGHKSVVHTDSSLWKFQCVICWKRFPMKSSLETHIRRHTGDTRFKCDKCQKEYITKNELRRHVHFYHTKLKLFQCTLCEKQFNTKKNHKEHMAKFHNIGKRKTPRILEKNLSCPICNKKYVAKIHLERHVNAHMGIKPYACSRCAKRFSDKYNLQEHLRNLHQLNLDLKELEQYRDQNAVTIGVDVDETQIFEDQYQDVDL